MTEWNDEDHDFLDDLIRRLEDAWRTAGAADLAQFAPAADHRIRERALVALIQVDQELRWHHGQRKAMEEYLAEWPELQEKPACIHELQEAQRLLETDTRATPPDASAETHDFAPPNQPQAIRIRCPQCDHPVEILDHQQVGELTCPSCGSAFDVAAVATSRFPSSSGRGAGDEEAPRQIAHFELIELLGKGEFGHVWKARDSKLGRIVAIKIPRSKQFSQKEVERFVAEAQAPAELHHPNIATVHEIGQAGDLAYIVSEFVDGETLDAWVKARGGRLSPREAARLCATIAEALDYAHRCGVRHRDLKPRNIMIDPSGQPHIVDFGLAKRITGEAAATIEGAVFGTPAYMSPEQARGEGHLADGRTDIYSLGVILFELLTGERPFSGNVVTLMKHLAEDDPPSARTLRRDIPRDMEAICAKCLEKSPSRRYASARELAQDLDLYLNDDLVLARPHGVCERFWLWSKRHPGVAALTAAVVLSLIAGATASTILAFQWRDKAREAKQQSRKAESLMLTSQAREILPTNPRRSLSLAFESLMTTLSYGESPPEGATKTFQSVLDAIHMKTLDYLLGALDRSPRGPLVDRRAIVSPDHHWLVAVSMDNQLRRWDLTAEDPAKTCLVLGADDHFGDFMSITPDSRWLVASTSKGARLCDLKAHDPVTASGDLLRVEGEGGCSGFTDAPFLVSPDGHWLIMATCSCTQLYDLRCEEPWTGPRVLHKAAACVRFSQDSRWLVTRGAGNDRLWNLAARDPLPFSIQDKGQSAVFAVFAPDRKQLHGKQLLVVRSGAVPVLWDLTGREPTQRSSGLGNAADWNGILGAEFVADGHYLVAKGTDRICIWNTQTHQCLTTWMPTNPSSESPAKPTASPTTWPSKKTGNSTPARSTHQVVSRARFAPPAIVPMTPAPARSTRQVLARARFTPPATVPTTPAAARFTHQVAVLIDIDQDGTTSPTTLVPDRSAHGPSLVAASTDPISTVLSPDGHWLMVHRGNSAWLFDLKVLDPGCKPMALEPDASPIQTVSISPDSHWLLTQSLDVTRLWDLQTAKTAPAIKVFNADKGKPPLAAISPDSHWLALGNGEKTVGVWDLTAKHLSIGPNVLDGHENPIVSLAFGAENQLVTWDGWTACLWTLASGGRAAAIAVLPAYGESEGLLAPVSANGRWLISTDGHQTANLWDLRAPPSYCLPRPLREHKATILAVAISPDSRWAVTCGKDQKVCLWDLSSPDPASAPAVLTGDAEVVTVSISPDSHWLVTGSLDKNIRIWDLFLNQERREKKALLLSGHEAPVHQIAVSTDGHWLLTGSLDNTILLWELPAADPIPPCYRWHSGPQELPSGVRTSENKSLIALTDPASTLWNRYLQRFPPLQSAAATAQVPSPLHSIVAPDANLAAGPSVSPAAPLLPEPYFGDANPSPGNPPGDTFKQPSPSTPTPEPKATVNPPPRNAPASGAIYEPTRTPQVSPSPTPGPQQPTPAPVAVGDGGGWTAPTSPYSVQPSNPVPAHSSPPPSNPSPTAPSPTPGSSPSTPSPAVAPKVDLQLTGPPQAKVGDEVSFKAVVTNLGKVPAVGLTLRDSFDPGLDHRGTSMHTIDKDLPELAPNQSQSVRIAFTISGTGNLCQMVDVRYGNLVLATRKQSLTASPAPTPPPLPPPGTPAPAKPAPSTPPSPPPIGPRGLTLKLKSPSSATVGDAVEFLMEVTNSTSAPLTDVKVTCLLDANFLATDATQGFKIDGDGDHWTIPSLPSNQPMTFAMKANCVSAGLSACNRVQVACREGLRAEDRSCIEVRAAAQPASGNPAPTTPAPGSAGSRGIASPPLKVDQAPSGNSKDTEKFAASADAGVAAVSFSGQFTRPDGSNPARLFIKVAIKPGWEIHSITQAPKGPTRTELKIKPSNQFHFLGGFQTSTPPQKRVDPLYKELTIETHQRTAIWYAPIQFAAGVDPASLRIEGAVYAQTCELPRSEGLTGLCLPPRDFPFVAALGQGLPVEELGAAPAPSPAEDGSHTITIGDKLTMAAPGSWIVKRPGNPMILQEFAVPAAKGDPRDGRIAVSSAGGTVAANVDRWAGQFSQPDGSKTADKMKVQKKTLAGKEVTLVDVSGTYQESAGIMQPAVERPDYRTLAAIIPGEGSSFFVKFYGPKKTVGEREKEFRAMLDGLKPPSPSSSSQQPPDVGPSAAPPPPVPGGKVLLDTLFPPYHPPPPPLPGGQKAASQEHLTWRPFTLAGLKRVAPQFDGLGYHQIPVVAILPAGDPNHPICFPSGQESWITEAAILDALAKAGPSQAGPSQSARQSFPAEQQARSKLQRRQVIVVADPETTHVICVTLKLDHADEAALDQLPAIYRLESSRASGAGIDDELLKPLAQMSNLASLFLSDKEMSDGGVSCLLRLPAVVALHLAGTGVTDHGLEYVEHLDTLHILDLSRTKVTDAGLERLVRLPHLDWLLLNEDRITDAGLARLSANHSIHRLSLAKTSVTAEGIHKIKQAIPDLKTIDGP